MHRKMNYFDQYEELSKQISVTTKPKNNKLQIREMQNIAQHEEHKIEKFLENGIFESLGGEIPQLFSERNNFPK